MISRRDFSQMVGLAAAGATLAAYASTPTATAAPAGHTA
ncbi:MAG: hypothetical protein QOD97_2970, partial [Mycobacterium sp.]|nr:hypothetical protein [Mycobacterium sp.]